MLTDAPEIEEVLTEFKEWVGRHFVAHNASFICFIDTGYERLGFGPSTNGVIVH